MAQENKYRDADKNMYSIPQPQMPEYYRYTDIGLNSNGSFNGTITITETDPIYFVAWICGRGTMANDGSAITNNTSIPLLIRIVGIVGTNSTYTASSVYSLEDDTTKLFAESALSGTFFGLKSGETAYLNYSKDALLDVADAYGFVYVRPLFVS